jgi:hypothetical protein
MAPPRLPEKLATIRRYNSSRFQIAGIELHAKAPAIAGSRKADINIYRTDVVHYQRATAPPRFCL